MTGSDTDSEYKSSAQGPSTKFNQSIDNESRRLNNAPKTSAERCREFRARKALLKQQSKQQQESDAIVEVATEDNRSTVEKRAKSAKATRRWREKTKGFSESSKKQAKTAAQRMREYRQRKKLAKKILLKQQSDQNLIISTSSSQVNQRAGPSTTNSISAELTRRGNSPLQQQVVTSDIKEQSDLRDSTLPLKYDDITKHKKAHENFDRKFRKNPFGYSCTVRKNDLKKASDNCEDLLKKITQRQTSDWVETTRARNILTLEERVRAIREFDRQPVYQKVADIMNCSAKQIRNIVLNRESILLYYASKTGECQGGFSKHKDRQQKIDLLNRVMFEWIQRTQSREDIGRISTKLIRTIALDIKNHVKVPSFYPNSYWLETFMKSYNLTEDDLLSQKVYERCGEPKEHLSLKISDIVEDVKKLDGQSYTEFYKMEKNDVKFVNKAEDSSSNSLLYENSNSGTGDDYEEVRVVIENDDEEDHYLVAPSKIRKVEKTKKTPTDDGGIFIDSYEEALRHLKPLEDFVLLEENFRAIGVISQLETIFKNPNNSEME